MFVQANKISKQYTNKQILLIFCLLKILNVVSASVYLPDMHKPTASVYTFRLTRFSIIREKAQRNLRITNLNEIVRPFGKDMCHITITNYQTTHFNPIEFPILLRNSEVIHYEVWISPEKINNLTAECDGYIPKEYAKGGTRASTSLFQGKNTVTFTLNQHHHCHLSKLLAVVEKPFVDYLFFGSEQTFSGFCFRLRFHQYATSTRSWSCQVQVDIIFSDTFGYYATSPFQILDPPEKNYNNINSIFPSSTPIVNVLLQEFYKENQVEKWIIKSYNNARDINHKYMYISNLVFLVLKLVKLINQDEMMIEVKEIMCLKLENSYEKLKNSHVTHIMSRQVSTRLSNLDTWKYDLITYGFSNEKYNNIDIGISLSETMN